MSHRIFYPRGNPLLGLPSWAVANLKMPRWRGRGMHYASHKPWGRQTVRRWQSWWIEYGRVRTDHTYYLAVWHGETRLCQWYWGWMFCGVAVGRDVLLYLLRHFGLDEVTVDVILGSDVRQVISLPVD